MRRVELQARDVAVSRTADAIVTSRLAARSTAHAGHTGRLATRAAPRSAALASLLTAVLTAVLTARVACDTWAHVTALSAAGFADRFAPRLGHGVAAVDAAGSEASHEAQACPGRSWADGPEGCSAGTVWRLAPDVVGRDVCGGKLLHGSRGRRR
jgi:hypothetical protein